MSPCGLRHADSASVASAISRRGQCDRSYVKSTSLALRHELRRPSRSSQSRQVCRSSAPSFRGANRKKSRGETLIDIGDLSHHQVLLLKRPRWQFEFDYDSAKAAETRIRLFDQIVQERHAILAYHFQFPGSGICARMPMAIPGSPPRST